MNRILVIQTYLEQMLEQITDDDEKRAAYIHLYGVSQAAALIARKRGLDAELAAIAGLLHDIGSYCGDNMNSCDCSQGDDSMNTHAHTGSRLALDILRQTGLTSSDENALICSAIFHHSDKERADKPFDEVIKDADVMQHLLFNVTAELDVHIRARAEQIENEFGLTHSKRSIDT